MLVPTFEMRVRAFAIDTAAVMLLIILSLGMSSSPTTRVILAFSFIFIVYFLPYFFLNGQTYGKLNQKIKVVNIDGSDAKIIKILARDIFKILLSFITFGIYMIVGFFILSDNKKSQTIHDFIFKTKCISLDKSKQYKEDYLSKTDSAIKRGL